MHPSSERLSIDYCCHDAALLPAVSPHWSPFRMRPRQPPGPTQATESELNPCFTW